MTAGARSLSPISMVGSLRRNRDLIKQLAWRSFTSRYKGSLFGIAWSVLHPLLLLAIYTLVFGYIFRSRWARMSGSSQAEFALALFCGLAPFRFFAEVLNRSPTIVLAVPNYVKKVVFPLEVLCVSEVLAAMVQLAVSLGLLVVGCLLVLGRLHWTLLWLPLAMVPLLFLTLGLSWLLASLGVFLRDIGHVTLLLTQMMFFLTPIFYDVNSPHVPHLMRQAMVLNPMAAIVETFRRAVLWGEGPPWARLAAVTFANAAILCAGYAWFVKSRRAFNDVI
jgi:lipopolysaccharide transport system permease protein